MMARVVSFLDPSTLVSPPLRRYLWAGIGLVFVAFGSLLATSLAPFGAAWVGRLVEATNYVTLTASVGFLLFALALLVLRPLPALLAGGVVALVLVGVSRLFSVQGPWDGILGLALLNSFSLFFVSGILVVYNVEDALEEVGTRFPRHARLVPMAILAILLLVGGVAVAAGLRTLVAASALGVLTVLAAVALQTLGRLRVDDATPAYLLALTFVLLGGIGQTLLALRPDGAGSGYRALGAYAVFFLSLLYTALKMGRKVGGLQRARVGDVAALVILAGVMSVISHTQLAYVASGAEAFSAVAQAKFDYTLAGIFLGFLLYYARAIEDLGDAFVLWAARRRARHRARVEERSASQDAG